MDRYNQFILYPYSKIGKGFDKLWNKLNDFIKGKIKEDI